MNRGHMFSVKRTCTGGGGKRKKKLHTSPAKAHKKGVGRRIHGTKKKGNPYPGEGERPKEVVKKGTHQEQWIPGRRKKKTKAKKFLCKRTTTKGLGVNTGEITRKRNRRKGRQTRTIALQKTQDRREEGRRERDKLKNSIQKTTLALTRQSCKNNIAERKRREGKQGVAPA